MAPTPNRATRYAIGMEAARHLDPNHTFAEIARELGTDRKQAYNETMLALGTLVWRLRQTLRIETR